MQPFPFTDAVGRAWNVYDCRVEGGGPTQRKRGLPVGDFRAEYRAFVPVGRDGPVMIHHFGLTPYRETKPQTLEQQLHFSKPLGASASQRLDR